MEDLTIDNAMVAYISGYISKSCFFLYVTYIE